MIKAFFISLLSLFFFLVLGYELKELNLKKIEKERIEKNDHKFIKTDLGAICFNLYGSIDGELIILMHGWSYSKEVFSKNIKSLIKNGYRVLTFDHFGRGCSDRPKTIYDKNFYERQVLGLINALKIKKPFHLLGYSMGGAVATMFASRHPEKVKKLILINPIGAGPSLKGEQKLLLIPVVGKFLMSYFGKSSIMKGVDEELKRGHLTSKMSFSFKQQFKYRGTVHGLLSCLKNFVSKSQISEYKKIHSQKTPLQLIWAENDIDADFKGHQVFQKHIPGLIFKPIKNVDHGVLYSHPHLINELIIDYLTAL